MQILAPVNDIASLPLLYERGAREFYAGFESDEWRGRFGEYSDINRLTLFKATANRYRLEDMEKLVGQVHLMGARIYITLNAPGYRAEEMKLLEGYIETLAAYGADGVITGVPELIAPIKRSGMKAVASTMCGIQSTDMAEFFQSLGVDRVIFPREADSEDISSVMENVLGLEYEVFLMRNGCRFSDDVCLGLHGGEHGAFCYSMRTGETRFHLRPGEEAMREDLERAHRIFCSDFRAFACGQCALYRFLRMGVSAVKIVGRMDEPEEVAKDVGITARNIEIARYCESEEEYLAAMVMPDDPDSYCRGGLSCYYPEVRFDVSSFLPVGMMREQGSDGRR